MVVGETIARIEDRPFNGITKATQREKQHSRDVFWQVQHKNKFKRGKGASESA